MNYHKIPCTIIRGGTSKGVFFHYKDLPTDSKERDRVILSAFGSPDTRQIDGLGGADTLTSKVAIIGPSKKDGADIDYTFGQVSMDEASINYSLNCGNISSGAAIFAVDEGLVKVEEPITTVRIFNTNTKTFILAKVRVENGKAATSGDFRIDGVPGKGSLIELTFLNASGAITGELLPTKNVVDTINLSNGKKIDVSVVDAGNLYVFVKAADIGLIGNETPKEIEENKAVIGLSKEIFETCSQILNERMKPDKEIKIHKMALVSGVEIMAGDSTDLDFVSRIISSNKKVHKAYAVTGAISAGSAAVIGGSVVNRVLSKNPGREITIGHPQGKIEIEIECRSIGGRLLPVNAVMKRTARRIMDGYVYIPKQL